MPQTVDLTTLTDLKNYINPALPPSTASDSILAKIITAVSQGINRYCSRTIAVGTFAEVRNGNGRTEIRTLVYPILSVLSVVIAPIAGAPGRTIYPSVGTNAPSVVNDSWFIYLNPTGYCGQVFEWGKQNVTLNYIAGYITPGQMQVIALPAWTAAAAIQQNAQIQSGGFYFEALTGGTTGATLPSFNTARNAVTVDNGVTWLCQGAVPSLPANANPVPEDFQQACMQQSALLFKNRTRVGDTGSGIGPDKINYFLKDAHPSTLELLKRHREVFPTDGMGVV